MDDEWKLRERQINAHFMKELKMELARLEVKPTHAAQAAGFTQQQGSAWLANKRTMTVPRYVAMLRAAGANDMEISATVARATLAAREAGLLPADNLTTRTEALIQGIKERDERDDEGERGAEPTAG